MFGAEDTLVNKTDEKPLPLRCLQTNLQKDHSDCCLEKGM